MLQAVTAKYAGGCMMLMRREGYDVHFLGTAFFVHHEGYLLTAAHNFNPDDQLVAVPAEDTGDFMPMTLERVDPIPVQPVQVDPDRDAALLKLEPEMEIGVPGRIFGNPVETEKGATVMALGFSFGHYRLHNLMGIHAVLAGKLISPNGTRVLLFDRMVHYGDAGAPLVNAEDGKVVGIVSGRFNLMELTRSSSEREQFPDIDVSYAVSIEYAVELMNREGLKIG